MKDRPDPGTIASVLRTVKRAWRGLHRARSWDTVETFRGREKYRANYRELCSTLVSTLDFATVLDLGSANGFVIDAMLEHGKDVRGVELSPAVGPLLSGPARERTMFADATGIGTLASFDLVTCIEVAEHIPPSSGPALVDAIVRNARHWVYFTAASPYQGGVGHVNCRPQFYWLLAFWKRGFELDYTKTDELVRSIEHMEPATWLPLNSLVLRRRNSTRPATDEQGEYDLLDGRSAARACGAE